MEDLVGRVIENYRIESQIKNKPMFIGMDIKSNIKVAIKRYSFNAHNYLIKSEILTLTKIYHKHLITPLDILEYSSHVFVIYEYSPGESLTDYVHRKKNLEINEVKEITRQLLHGYKALVKNNLLHRNIKPDNVLIVQKNPLMVKLCDIGIKQKESYVNEFYIAPEIQLMKGRSNIMSDIWSFGAVIYFMVNGKSPGKQLEEAKSNVDDLIKKCLEYEPSKRISLEQIERLPFITESNEVNSLEEQKGQHFYYDPWRVVKFIMGKYY